MRKLLLLDHSLRDTGGHHYPYASSVLLAAEALSLENNKQSDTMMEYAVECVAHENAGVRVAAMRAIAASRKPVADSAKAIVAAWPKFDYDFQKSAAVGALAQNSAAAIAAILDNA